MARVNGNGNIYKGNNCLSSQWELFLKVRSQKQVVLLIVSIFNRIQGTRETSSCLQKLFPFCKMVAKSLKRMLSI